MTRYDVLQVLEIMAAPVRWRVIQVLILDGEYPVVEEIPIVCLGIVRHVPEHEDPDTDGQNRDHRVTFLTWDDEYSCAIPWDERVEAETYRVLLEPGRSYFHDDVMKEAQAHAARFGGNKAKAVV